MSIWHELQKMSPEERWSFVIAIICILAILFLLPWLFSIGCVTFGGSHSVCGI